MVDSENLLQTARILVSRLERLSADSIWAHRASGLRGALMRALQAAEQSQQDRDLNRLQNLVSVGFKMLENAAREIPDPSNSRSSLQQE